MSPVLPITPLGQSGKYIRMAVVAGQGFGKTVFCATAQNALFLMSDREGAESAVSLGIGRGNDELKINHFEKGDNSLFEALNYMHDEGCSKYDWLIHDNATVENRLALKAAMEQKGGRASLYVPAKGAYQYSQNGFLSITEDFYDLPINQIWIVRPKLITVDDPEKGTIDLLGADIQNPQVAEQFLGLMPIVGMGMVREAEVDGKKKHVRRMYFSHRDPYRGKDRTNALGNFKDDLTVPRMQQLIEAKRATRQSTTRRTTKKTAARRRTA